MYVHVSMYVRISVNINTYNNYNNSEDSVYHGVMITIISDMSVLTLELCARLSWLLVSF